MFIYIKKCLLLFALLLLANTMFSQSLELFKFVDSTLIRTDVEFTYRLQFRCASIESDCENVIIRDTLPAGMKFVESLDSPLFSSSTNYDPNTRVIEFELNKQTGTGIMAGSTGEVFFKAIFPNGETPNNLDVINYARILADGVPTVTSNPVTTTSQASSPWIVEKTSGNTIFTDTDFTYTIKVSDPGNGAPGSLNLDTLTIIDQLPANAIFVSASDGGVYDGSTVTWAFDEQIVNNDRTVTVTVQYPSTHFNIGDGVTNMVELYGEPVGEPYNLLDSDDQAGIISPPNPLAFINKSVDRIDAIVGDTLNYSIDVDNAGSTALDNVIFIDTIPAQVELYQIQTGVYNFANTITISYQTNTLTTWQTWTGSPFATNINTTLEVSDLGLPNGDYITLIRYEFGTLPSNFSSDTNAKLSTFIINPDRDGAVVMNATEITNCADLYYDFSTTTYEHENCVNADVRNIIPPSVAMTKGNDKGNFPIGGDANYFLVPSNAGDFDLDSLVMVDSIPNIMDLEYTESGGWSNLIEDVEVYYQTNLNSTYQAWTNSPYAPTSDTRLNVSTLNLSPNEYVTVIKWIFRNPARGFENNGSRPRIVGTVMETDRTGATVVAGGVINNCAYVTGYLDGIAYQDSDCEAPTILPPVVEGVPQKTFLIGNNTSTTAGPFFPGDTVTYILHAENLNSSTDTLVNPILVDLLPPELNYISGSWEVYDNDENLVTPIFEEIQNYNSTGRTLLRWSWTDAAAENFLPGYQYEILFKTVVGTNVFADQVIQNFGYQTTNDVPSYSCEEEDDNDINDLDGDGISTETLCYSSTVPQFEIQSVASLVSEKLVKGQLDTAYSKFPNFGSTIPGGEIDYQMFVRNNGTVPMTNLVIIDILPFVGDKGVIDTSDRLTRWRPNMTSPLNVPTGVTVYYSTEENPCRSNENIEPSGPAGCIEPNWSITPPDDIATVQSVKIDFNNTIINPGDELLIEWNMRAPVDALDNLTVTTDTIAWNSFGYIADKVNPDGSIGDALLAAEPIKVGIRLEEPIKASYGNYVWHDVNQDGIQNTGEAGIDGVRVELYIDNGDGISNPSTDSLIAYTLTANDGLYLFPELDADDYFAVFYQPPTYTVSPTDEGADDALDSDGVSTQINGVYQAITPVTTIDMGEDDPSWDLGIFQSNTAAVGNYVWYDVNQDGLQNEAASYGINNISVFLYDGTGVLVDSTSTTNDTYGNAGYYLFDSIPPNNYYVEFKIPLSFSITSANQSGVGSDANDSDITLTADTTIARTETFTIVANQYDPNWDAGLILPTGIMSLGNFVWIDNDNNGGYDPVTESGIDGVIVNLYEDSNGDGVFTPNSDAFLATTTTTISGSKSGHYLFENLAEGDYIVQIAESNFTGNGLLNGYSSSTGNGIAPDPDNNLNFDDNGEPLEGYGIVSQAVSLIFNTEPTNDEDNDNNSNLTVDFGFFPGTPCEVLIDNISLGACNENGGNPMIELSFTTHWFNTPNPAENLLISIDGNAQTPLAIEAGSNGQQTYTLNIPADGSTSSIEATFDNTTACSVTEAYTVFNGCPLQMIKTADKVEAEIGDIVTYTYEIFNNSTEEVVLSDITDDKIGTITTQSGGGDRASSDLQALYVPANGTTTTINDISGVGDPLDLTIENNDYVWGPNYIEFTDPNRASNLTDNNKIYTASTASNELTVEAWITPANTSQNGPARIITLSQDGSNRNFSMTVQGSSFYEIRLRTSPSDPNGTSTLLRGGTVTTATTHVVMTKDAAGNGVLYVNGVVVDTETYTGDFSAWDPSYDFAMGHEFGAASTSTNRDWQGRIHLGAVYSRALTATEVMQNYNEGIVEPTAPTVIAPNTSASFTATYEVLASDAPGPVVNTANVIGVFPNGNTVTPSDTASVKIICNNLTVSQFDVQPCNDNGTNSIDTDDFYTININANHNNGGVQYEIVLNLGQASEQILATENYGTPVTIGSNQELQADGVSTYQITVRDASLSSCQETIDLPLVDTCSNCPSEICLPVNISINKGE